MRTTREHPYLSFAIFIFSIVLFNNATANFIYGPAELPDDDWQDFHIAWVLAADETGDGSFDTARQINADGVKPSTINFGQNTSGEYYVDFEWDNPLSEDTAATFLITTKEDVNIVSAYYWYTKINKNGDHVKIGDDHKANVKLVPEPQTKLVMGFGILLLLLAELRKKLNTLSWVKMG